MMKMFSYNRMYIPPIMDFLMTEEVKSRYQLNRAIKTNDPIALNKLLQNPVNTALPPIPKIREQVLDVSYHPFSANNLLIALGSLSICNAIYQTGKLIGGFGIVMVGEGGKSFLASLLSWDGMIATGCFSGVLGAMGLGIGYLVLKCIYPPLKEEIGSLFYNRDVTPLLDVVDQYIPDEKDKIKQD